eukprot:CAMPEP_0179297278 /NCGR_PEP_ID=MMETSP0797-20121207/45381_1 /TAXON_ID=47934 /ORGANISM="Dinophysis acuminata, Strain DAEP01" /LENGTH=133 /DNA_ID=CAMNT_0021006601 /DNA_START=50 /DNA_END=449 /DNA_ORIENTATION=-
MPVGKIPIQMPIGQMPIQMPMCMSGTARSRVLRCGAPRAAGQLTSAARDLGSARASLPAGAGLRISQSWPPARLVGQVQLAAATAAHATACCRARCAPREPCDLGARNHNCAPDAASFLLGTAASGTPSHSML